MFKYIKDNIYPIPTKYEKEFKINKFNRNNFRILLVSSFLIVEQLYYALFVSTSGSLSQKVFYATSFIMIIFAVISIYFYYNKPLEIKIYHNIYVKGIGIIGITIVLIRVVISSGQIIRLPTVYIALIYGLAVIFYYGYLESLFIYLYGIILLYFVASMYNPTLLERTIISDALSNNMIAWIASMVIYRKFINEFINQKMIEEKNKKLNKINIKLKEISDQDKLTGIYNRRKLDDILKDIHNESQRYNNDFSIILLDLDHFKEVNDNYGHQTGDEVLKEVSSLLLDKIRKVDYCGRWGGEEFLIILPETDLDSAVILAERLRGEIEDYEFTKVGNITSSFGVASYLENKDIREIIKAADDALYKAKEEGRNRVETIENKH
ncbi:MAG: GGDEF domain-containing protein [Halanaerobiales bacterium]